jgi:hypothetical protein
LVSRGERVRRRVRNGLNWICRPVACSEYSPPSLTFVTIPNERGETFFGAAALFDWARVWPTEATDVDAEERTADMARAPVRAKRPEKGMTERKRSV